MKIYLVTNNDDGASGYDTYDSMVVVANSIDEAKQVSAGGEWPEVGSNKWRYRDWAGSPDLVDIEELGEYTGKETDPDIILASFNAG